MTPKTMDGLKHIQNKKTPLDSAKGQLPSEIGTDYTFKRKIVWKNAIGFLILHLVGIYGMFFISSCYTATVVWMYVIAFLSGEGVTMGAHRLYSHRAYKATFSLRLLLIILQTVAGQNCLYVWVRDHRQHHKYSDTDADPHNANRGFFFSHVGWLMSRKHPAVIEKGKNVDMSDLEADWLVMFQKEHYKVLYTIFAIIIPVGVPVYFWNESYINSLFVCYLFRNIMVLNVTWCVNSIAHLFGTKPFDKFILPVESAFVAFISIGEGWHNYHHTFPWDYRAAEFGSRFGLTTRMIDLMAYLGLAYDLKAAPYKLIEQRTLRTGDGTHPVFGKKQVGWNDEKNVSEEDVEKESTNIKENDLEMRNVKDDTIRNRTVAVQG